MASEQKVDEKNLKKVLVPMADGSEDLEAVTIIDVLRRTKKVNLIIAKVGNPKKKDNPNNLNVTLSRGTKVVCDVGIDSLINDSFDLIALPGGMPGATYLHMSKSLTQILTKHNSNNKSILGAVCASPAVVFAQDNKILQKNENGSCYPADKFLKLFKDNGVNNLNNTNTVTLIDGNKRKIGGDNNNGGATVVTSQGPGTALEFSLTLVELLFGLNDAKTIGNAMLVKPEYTSKIGKL